MDSGLPYRDQLVSQAGDPRAVQQRPAHRDDVFPVSASGTRSRCQILAICGLLLLAVGLVFGQAVRHDFVNYDDDMYVYENPQVAHGLTVQGIARAFTQSCGDNWVPLTWISLMLDCQLYGLNAGGYHLTNVLLHAATAVLLFLVLRRMTGRLWPNALVAALFAVHPLRAESVAWVTERKDVLSGLFFMLALWAYLGYVRERFSLARYAWLIVVFALGLLAKPMLVTLPFVLLLLDYWPLGRTAGHFCSPPMPPTGRRDLDPTPPHCNGGAFFAGTDFSRAMRQWLRSNRHLLIEKIPLFALAAGDCLVTIVIQDRTLASTTHLPLWWRLGNAAVTYVTYLGQFFYPVGLVAVYPRAGLDLPRWEIGAACLLLASITAAAFLGRRRCPYLLVGWLWYLGMLAPVIGLLQVGCTSMADRFTYLPQIGLCIALAWGLADVCRSWPSRRRLWGVGVALALAFLMGWAWRQTSFCATARPYGSTPSPVLRKIAWPITAWRDSAIAGKNRRSDCSVSEGHRHRPAVRGGPLQSCASSVCGERVDEAIAQLQQAVEIQPDFAEAQGGLGAALVRRGRLDEAIAHYREALEIDPDSAIAHANLGNVFLNQGRPDKALEHFRKIVELSPESAGARNNLGVALAALGRFDHALVAVPQGAATPAGLRGSAEESGLAAGDLPPGVAAQRRRSHRARPPRRPALRQPAGRRAGCAGRGLCRGGPLFRGPQHRPQGSGPGHPPEGPSDGGCLADADRVVRSWKALSSAVVGFRTGETLTARISR